MSMPARVPGRPRPAKATKVETNAILRPDPKRRDAPLVRLSAEKPRPQVRRWLQSFLLDALF